MGKYSDFFASVEQQDDQPDTYLEVDKPTLEQAKTPAAPTPKAEPASRSILKDAAGLWGMGAGSLVKGAGWLFNSDELQTLGQDTFDYWERTLSDTQREANQKRFVNNDWSIGEGATDLNTLFGVTIQSLPQMIPGIGVAGLAGRGALALGLSQKAASGVAAAGSSIGEGVTVGAMVGQEVDQTIRSMTEDEKLQSPYYADLRKLYDEEEATARLSKMAANPAALKAGVVSAALGYSFDRFLGDALTGRLSGGAVKEGAKGAVIEAGTETAQSGFEAFTKQSALNEYAAQPMSYTDIVNEMVAGMAAGGVMGGAIGAAGGLQGQGGQEEQRPPEQQQRPTTEERVVNARQQAEAAGADPLEATTAGAQELLNDILESTQETPAPLQGESESTLEPITGLLSEAEQISLAPEPTPTQPEITDTLNAEQPPTTESELKPRLLDTLTQPDAEPDGAEIVYDQDGTKVRKHGDRMGYEATSDQFEGAAWGKTTDEARRALTQLMRANQPKQAVLQNRDRSRPAYVEQMQAIANAPDYDRVSVSREPNTGAPMVFQKQTPNAPEPEAPIVWEADKGATDTVTMSDGKGGFRKIPVQYAVIEADAVTASNNADGTTNESYGTGGLTALNNGRTAGLQAAFEQGNSQPYVDALLADNAHGIAPEAIRSKKRPLLVRLFDEAALEGINDPGAASNVSASAELSAVEQAQTDARKLDLDLLTEIVPGDVTGSGNMEFVRRVTDLFGKDGGGNSLRDAKGLLTAQGQKRIKGALVERAYEDQTITQELTEAADSDLKTLGDALAQAAGRWALMRERAREQSINPDMDITDALVSAVNMIRKSRQEGKALADLAGQVDAFAGEADQMAVEILHLFYHGKNFGRIRAKDVIAQTLLDYVDAALASSPGPDMFGETTTPQNVLEAQRGRIEGTNQDEAAPGVQPDGANDREDGEAGEGPVSSAGRETDAEQSAEPEPENEIDAAAAQANTAPTEAQKEAGNYQKGHIKIHGLDISIENPKGSLRSGTDPDGQRWESTMAHHYGYLKRTEGADGDQVDVFIGPNPDSDNVFIVDQVNAGGSFDEHKVLLGFPNKIAARRGYLANYQKGWKAGPITRMSMNEFKAWMRDGDTTRPVKAQAEATPGPAKAKQEDATPEESPSMPAAVPVALGQLKVTPLSGAMYRETSPEGITSLIREVFSNSPEQGAVTNIFVTDDPGLAIGQGKNKGVMIEFDGQYLSGKENQKPGTGIIGGREFAVEYVNRNAITRFTLPKGIKLRGPARIFAGQEFTRQTQEDGSTVYTRKGAKQSPNLELVAQTETDLAEQAATKAAADKAEADQRKQAEQKEKADAEADDFVLSGSDSPIDQAEARGQGNMFDVMGRPEAGAAPASERKAAQIASKMTEAEILAEIDSLSALADERMAQAVSANAESALPAPIEYLDAQEAARFADLKAALPSAAQERTEARARIERRAAGRKAKGGTVTAHGITVRVPVIDQQLIDDFNRNTYIAGKRDLNQELRDAVTNILDSLAEKSNTLTTDEQKAKAKELIEAYIERQAEFARWDASYNARNPSWIVTGRSNRNMDKANRKNEKHMDEYSARVGRLDAQRKRIESTLYDMRPDSVKNDQAVKADQRRITQLVADIAMYMSDGRQTLEKETRKWASPKAHKAIERALERDRIATISHIQETENSKTVQDLGGLIKILGPRSKASKLVQQLLDEQLMVREQDGVPYYRVSEDQIALDFDAEPDNDGETDNLPSRQRGSGDAAAKANDVGRRASRIQNQRQRARQIERQSFLHGLREVTSAAEAAHVLAPFRKDAHETMLGLVLDANRKPLAIIRHTKGTVDGAPVYPEQFVSDIASVPGADSVWLSHNHPSGRMEPSQADLKITQKLGPMIKNANLQLEGHVIIGFGRDHTAFDVSDRSDGGLSLTAAAVRKHKIPVLERQIASKGGMKDATPIRNPQGAVAALKDMANKDQTGVMLLDNAHRPLGFLDLSGYDLDALRDAGVYREVLQALASTNANAGIIQAGSGVSDTGNLQRMLADIGDFRLLDAVHVDIMRGRDADYSSIASEGSLQTGVWFSREGYRRTHAQTTPTLTAAQAVEFTRDLMKGWKGAPEVVIADRISEFPKRLRDAIRAAQAEGDMRGVFFEGKVYILAPRIPSRAALEEVILHEVVGHYGLRTMLGAELKPLLNEVYLKFAQTEKGREIKRNYFPGDSFDAKNANHRLTVAEELLAHLAETGKHQKLWTRIVAAIRDGLRRLGFTLELSETDLLNILAGAQKTVEQGGISRPSSADSYFRRAYHGTPHRFDKFSLEAIGTGEGAQAYGWGLYFAGNRGVADYYKDTLAQVTLEAKTDAANERLRGALNYADGAPSEVEKMVRSGGYSDARIARELASMAEELEASSTGNLYYAKAYRVISELIDAGELEVANKAHLYEVEIPDDNDLLDYDRELSDQPDSIQAKLNELHSELPEEFFEEYEDRFNIEWAEWTGKELLRALQTWASESALPRETDPMGMTGNPDQDVSLMFSHYGIPGLRFLDGNSRRQGDGDRNYVIWDESVVSVQAVNDEVAQAEAYFSRTGQKQTNTDAFRKWFGDSKIVDENGEPLVVYHGTNSEFTEFNPDTRGSNTAWANTNLGFYFIADHRLAQEFAEQSGGDVVVGAYLSIQQPLNLTRQELFSNEGQAATIWEAVTGERLSNQDALDAINEEIGLGELADTMEALATDDAKAIMERDGYDGVISEYGDGHLEYVAFRPGQIKSATGNSGAFDTANPDIRFSRTGTRDIDQFTDLDEAQRRAFQKIAPPTPTESAKEWLAERTNRWQTKLRQGMVDRFAALMDMDEAVHGKDVIENSTASSSWVLAQMAGAASGALQSMLTTARIHLDPREKVIKLRDGSDKGLNDVLGQLGSAGEIDRFFGWIAGNRAIKLMEEGRENLFEKDEAEGLARANEGVTADGQDRKELYAQVFDEFQKYRDDILEIADTAGLLRKGMEEDEAMLFLAQKYEIAPALVERYKKAMRDVDRADDEDVRDMAQARAGEIWGTLAEEIETGVENFDEEYEALTTDQRDLWANDFYVPFYRESEREGQFSGPMPTSGLSRQKAYQRLKGGTGNLRDLLENTMLNFHHLLQASLKNQAAIQAIDNAQAMGIAEATSENSRDPENSTFILREGKKVWYNIDDPLVYKAVTALAHPGMNSAAMKVMRGFKRLFTNLTTTTPQFVIANLLRDSMQASATSEVSKNMLKNMAQGSKAYGNQRFRARMLASGGSFSFGHLYGENADEVKLQLTGGLARADILRSPSMIPAAISGVWRHWNEVTNFTENINRAAIYQQNVDEKGELYAAFKSRDLMNFSQHGAWPAMRILIDVVPFLNARLQGLDKIYRSGVKPGIRLAFGQGGATDKQAMARFWSVTGAVALATMALFLKNRDDEEYQRLEEWQKDTYWFIRTGEDSAIFLPKPFEVGAIATMIERLTEQAVSDTATGELFRERLGHMLMGTFSFSPVPQMFQPALDVYANYDAFTGRPIESMGMERLSPSLRTRGNTTALAKGLSKVTETISGADGQLTLSPVQIDHMISGYFGSVGAWVAGIGDTIWRTANGEVAPDKFWYEYQPVKRFYKNLGDEDKYTRYGTVFYEALKESNRVFADIREYQALGDLESAVEVMRENRQTLALRQTLNRVQRQLTKINQAMEKVYRIPGESAYKRRELDRLRAMRNRIQESVGRELERIKAAG